MRAAAGAAMPVFSILFGNLMNAFGQNLDNYDELTDEARGNGLGIPFTSSNLGDAPFLVAVSSACVFSVAHHIAPTTSARPLSASRP